MNLCSVTECGRNAICKGFCNRHYMQMREHGKIISNSQRTRLDPNLFIIIDDICLIKLYNTRGNEIAESITNFKYKTEIEKYKWHLTSHGYASGIWYNTGGQHQILLHQLIIQLSGRKIPDGYEIDHKDGNRLNNLDDNLRVCTRMQNSQNKKLKSDNTSGQTGVHQHTYNKKWIAEITVDLKRIYLGEFDTKEDATRAYNEAAIKYFGEFAKLKITEGGLNDSTNRL